MNQSAEPTPSAETLARWTIPSGDGKTVVLTALAGQVTTVVGANGSGKSALGLWLGNQAPGSARRIIAHRRLWFASAGPNLTPAQRDQTAGNIRNWSASVDSRWIDHADHQRPDIALFDLLAKYNSENAALAEFLIIGAQSGGAPIPVSRRILDRLNDVMALAGLNVEIVLSNTQTFDARDRVTGALYPIHQMSDGEKSALLLAAEVLSSTSERVFIIDEPERHLHRAISARLVDAIIADRPDCHFVVLTHDLELATELGRRPGPTLSLTSCRWEGSNPTGWDLEIVYPGNELSAAVRRALLGGRRRLLFVEGDDSSLDKVLYEILYPDCTVVGVGGAEQVIRAVRGLAASEAHHWVQAWGIVDGDQRSQNERESLSSTGILALPVCEVESLYYRSPLIAAVREARKVLLGDAEATRAGDPTAIGLQVLQDSPTLDRLGKKLALEQIRRSIAQAIPVELDSTAHTVVVKVPSVYSTIRAELAELAAADDFDGLVARLPIKDTSLPTRVAKALGFQSSADYELAARTRMLHDPALAESTRVYVGSVPGAHDHPVTTGAETSANPDQ